MESFYPFLRQLVQDLWDAKGMYDQHLVNAKNTEKLQGYIKDEHIRAFEKRLKEGGGDIGGNSALVNLERDLKMATDKLQKYSIRNQSFCTIWESNKMMQKLEKLREKVTRSVNDFNNACGSNVSSIHSMHGPLPPGVRDEVVARNSGSASRVHTRLISSPYRYTDFVHFDKRDVDLCIERLKCSKGKERVQAVYKIRQWTSMGDLYQSYIAEQGITPLLYELSFSINQPIQEHSTVAFLQLAVSGNNTEWIAAADKSSLDALVSCLWKGSLEAREEVAAMLVHLSLREEVELSVKSRAAVIPALVALLERGSAQGKKHAATALFRLCDYQGQVAESLLHRAVEYNVVPVLLDLVREPPASAVLEEALAFLAFLATHNHHGRLRLDSSACMWLEIIDYSGSSPHNQENAVAILHALCSDDTDYCQRARASNGFEYLTAVSRSPVSTKRAKVEAKLLIEFWSWDPEAEENEEQDVFGLKEFFTDASTEALGNNRKKAKVDEDLEQDVYALTTLFKQDTSKMAYSKPRKGRRRGQ